MTDANVVLGRLPPALLGGEMRLDAAAAEEAVGKTARALGLDLHQAAQGILDIVNENMFGALRLVTVQKGLDPRGFALVAFGGAGPLHGNAMAILAGCYPVIVPPTPGVLSALGFLYSDVKNEFAHTLIRTVDEIGAEEVADALAGLGEAAAAWLASEGVPADRQSVAFELDVRYFRQGYEFPIPVEPEALRTGGLGAAVERFGELHERQYGFRLDQPVELVNGAGGRGGPGRQGGVPPLRGRRAGRLGGGHRPAPGVLRRPVHGRGLLRPGPAPAREPRHGSRGDRPAGTPPP